MKNKVIDELTKNGYVILRSFFSKKTISEVLDGYKKNLDYCLNLLGSNSKNSDINKKYDLLNEKDKKLKAKSYDLSKYHPSLLRLATDRKIEKLINSIFGETHFLDYPQIRVDDNKNSFLLPMHQEIYGQMSNKLLTLWCPLTDVSKYNGTLVLIPGSHKNGLLKHTFYKIKNKKYHGIEKKILKKKKIVSLNLKAGDAVLFDPYLIHGSGKNNSKKIRWTFVSRYNAISGVEYLKNKKSSLRIPQKKN